MTMMSSTSRRYQQLNNQPDISDITPTTPLQQRPTTGGTPLPNYSGHSHTSEQSSVYSTSHRHNNDNKYTMTDDDDDLDNDENDKAALAFLLRYEQMVRQQEAEEMATMAHLRPLFDRLRHLGGDDDDDTAAADQDTINASHASSEDRHNDSPIPALPPTDDGRNTSSHSGDPLSYDALNDDDDDDGDDNDGTTPRRRRRAEQINHTDSSNLLSFGGMTRALDILERSVDGEEVMTTDKQLMMVLSTITEGYMENPATTSSSKEEEEDDDVRRRHHALSFPEFYHCYKTVVTGMMVMQMLPNASHLQLQQLQQQNDGSTIDNNDNNNDSNEGILYHRTRTRDRVMKMMTNFCVTPENDDDDAKNNNNNTGMSPSEELKTLLKLKDRQLVKIIESHTGEIDDIADRYQETTTESSLLSSSPASLKRSIAQGYNRQRRRYRRIVSVLTGLLLLITGILVYFIITTHTHPPPTNNLDPLTNNCPTTNDLHQHQQNNQLLTNQITTLRQTNTQLTASLASSTSHNTHCQKSLTKLETTHSLQKSNVQTEMRRRRDAESERDALKQRLTAQEEVMAAKEATAEHCRKHLSYVEGDLERVVRRVEEMAARETALVVGCRTAAAAARYEEEKEDEEEEEEEDYSLNISEWTTASDAFRTTAAAPKKNQKGKKKEMLRQRVMAAVVGAGSVLLAPKMGLLMLRMPFVGEMMKVMGLFLVKLFGGV